MTYTLFVDESGHFGHDSDESEDWVVGGTLCPSDLVTAEKTIGNRLNPIPSQYGLDGRGDLHRTELNGLVFSHTSDWDFERIGDLTTSLFDAVFSAFPDSQFVAVRNPSQKGLSDPEETYRLMLLDLIALADSVLPPDANIDQLQICAATRTDTESGRMTTRTEVLERLPEIVGALEVDLASRGLMDIVTEEDVVLRAQHKSWGLTVADFWCNAVYNRDRKESGAAVDTLVNRGDGRVFTTWSGSARVRRALVAERDGHYGLALYRWSVLSSLDGDAYPNALECLCAQIASSARSPQPTFEQTIEMLWRRFGKAERYRAFIDALRQIEAAVESSADDLSEAEALLFRIRNMIHLAANRDGLTGMALDIGEVQKNAETQIGYDPEYFSLILDSQLHRIHTQHHALNFTKGLQEAKRHRERVQDYGALWDLMDDDQDHSFEASRMSLKAEMTWIESRIRAANPDDALDDVLTRVMNLKSVPMADYDRSRLWNYSILARLKRGAWEDALAESLRALNQSTDQYTLAHAARSAATSILVDESAYSEKANRIFDRLKHDLSTQQTGVFPGLARRDTALLANVLTNDNREARTDLQKGRDALTWSPQDPMTPIREWVSWTFDLTGQFLSEGDDIQTQVPSAFQGALLDTDVISGRNGFLSARRVSPY